MRRRWRAVMRRVASSLKPSFLKLKGVYHAASSKSACWSVSSVAFFLKPKGVYHADDIRRDAAARIAFDFKVERRCPREGVQRASFSPEAERRSPHPVPSSTRPACAPRCVLPEA